MISLTILGTGNVAQNLFEAFSTIESVKVVQVVGRDKRNLESFRSASRLLDYNERMLPTDIYIIAVKDDAIAEVNQRIISKGLVVHTSGAASLSVLETHERHGVFYPLQTFTKGRILDFSTIPMCIEANNKRDLELLQRLGEKISDRVLEIGSTKRKTLHVSAVFANNFTNYMYSLGEEICAENDLDFSLLQPLIMETAAKLEFLDTKKAQTGPALRGDQQTLHAHLNLLKTKKHREIYTLLSNSIKDSYPLKSSTS